MSKSNSVQGNAATENLFLLEFLVDTVCIDPKWVQENIATLCGESCVQFQFLNNEPLDVCEADFMPKNNYAIEGGTFKSGKSILFALTPEQALRAVQDFVINVSVFKKLPGNALPDRVPVGQVGIQVVNQFNELLKSLSTENPQPAAKVIKDCFKLTNTTSAAVGSISVFIRISCFGKLIVTQFQMNLDDRSVLFKDNQGSSMYRYRKSQKEKTPPQSQCPEWNEAIGLARPDKLSNQPMSPMNANAVFGLKRGENMSESQVVPDNRCYQEIGAEMNGNALTIRVLKDKKKVVGSEEDCCCGGNTNCCGDPPQIQAIPEGPNPPSLNFKTGNTSTTQDIKVLPPTQAGPMQVTEITDPTRDVFVLRIGKKAENSEKKSNLELELRTPKGLDRKPPPKLETRDTQYEEADCGAPAAAPSAGGKKKKGKGKGKGKKKK